MMLFSDATLAHAPHSDHYKKHFIEPLDIIEEYDLGFHLGSLLKYILREEKSEGERIKDLEKAQFYLERYIELLKKREGEKA